MSRFFSYAKAHETYFLKHGQRVTYKKNEVLVNTIKDYPYVHFLTKGQVTISFQMRSGASRILGYFLPGMSFAQVGMFFGDANGDLEYTAVNDCTLYRVPMQQFLAHLQEDAEFNAEYLKWLLEAQILLIERIVYQGETTTERRLLRWMLFMDRYYADESHRVYIPTSHAVIADFIHTTRETVSRMMTKCITEGYLTCERKYMTLNVARIQSFLD